MVGFIFIPSHTIYLFLKQENVWSAKEEKESLSTNAFKKLEAHRRACIRILEITHWFKITAI